MAQTALVLSRQRVQGQTGDAWVRRPEMTLNDVEALGVELPELKAEEREALEIQVKYAGYIERAKQQLKAEQKARHLSLDGVEFDAIAALSNEAREKLTKAKPQNIEQASRLTGVRHADISALLVHLRQRNVSRET